MNLISKLALVALTAASTQLMASEAPSDMKQFNMNCPAQKLLPVLDAAYHECNKGFVNGSCERFVQTFRQLLPEYDCQRSFDAIPTQNFIVPAIWLAGDGALEDYVHLLSRMSSGKDRTFTDEWFRKDIAEAKKLFASKEFQEILDGHLSEEYGPLAKRLESELRK